MTDRRVLRVSAVTALGLVAGICAGAGGHVVAYGPAAPHTDSPLLAYGRCGEALTPDPRTPSVTVAWSEAARTAIRDRRVEVRAQRHPAYGWIVWTALPKSASNLDRLWLDWSYHRDPGDAALWRDCAQPVTAGVTTPAMKATDDAGRTRWFRACGQVPPPDRGPRISGVFCTEWARR